MLQHVPLASEKTAGAESSLSPSFHPSLLKQVIRHSFQRGPAYTQTKGTRSLKTQGHREESPPEVVHPLLLLDLISFGQSYFSTTIYFFIKRKHKMTQPWSRHLTQWLGCHLGGLGLNPGSAPESNFLLMHTLGGSRLSPCGPLSRPELFIQSWFQPGPAGHLEIETVDESTVCLSHCLLHSQPLK